jgi:hypothetical protein
VRSRPQVFSILTVTWIVGAVAATRVTFPLWMAPAALVRFRRSKVSTCKETTRDMRRATFALPFALSMARAAPVLLWSKAHVDASRRPRARTRHPP